MTAWLALKWGALAIGIVGALTALIFALGWFGAGIQVISPDNVRAQYSDAYARFADLKATACNVKQERVLVAKATDPNVQVQYQQQETAYEQNYRRIQADYDAAFANVFAAKHVGPSDLPHTAPDLGSMITAEC